MEGGMEQQQQRGLAEKKDKVYLLVQSCELLILARDGKPVFTWVLVLI